MRGAVTRRAQRSPAWPAELSGPVARASCIPGAPMGLEVLYVLIPVSVLLALGALVLFLWAIQSGQFDDLETPAIRILFDDAPAAAPGTPRAAESPAATPRLPLPARPSRWK